MTTKGMVLAVSTYWYGAADVRTMRVLHGRQWGRRRFGLRRLRVVLGLRLQPLQQQGRAIVHGRPAGFVQLVTCAGNGKVVCDRNLEMIIGTTDSHRRTVP